MKKLLPLLFILTFSFFTCLSQSKQEQAHIDSLLNKLSSEGEDTTKLKLYIRIFYAYLDVNPAAGLQNEKDAMALAEKLNWEKGTAELYQIIGRIYWKTGNFDQALKYHFDALKISKALDDEVLTAQTTVFIGQDYADQGNYSEALKYFNVALKMYEDNGDLKSGADCYLLFAFVYGKLGNNPEAAKANYAGLKIYESLGDKYSVAVATSNLADEYVKMEKFDEALKYYQQSSQALKSANDKENLSVNYICMGDVYRKMGNFNKAKANFLFALETGKEINSPYCIGRAYENMAITYRMEGNLDSTLYNYLTAERMYRTVSNKTLLASVCNQIGTLYLRLNNLTKAKEYFDTTIALSGDSANPSILKEYYNGLQSLDSLRGNWKDAYHNFRRYITARDSVYSEANTKSTLQTVMQYEFDKKEAAAKAEREKKDIQQRNIRNSISAGLAGALIFLVVVYRQRNKISKARKRSDELLLNILPSEVADELKEKGSADAKQFDQVTVMFTDFKGFTQISEKLSPTELLSEINSCFKAFDDIISKHNIEKIKTIGDSYMCAGGLPVANKTHAKDVVQAALEIQQFMGEHLERRKKEIKEVFEIRIGIHTGPVVAGIVGVKKFAYDIWGDTVNIASRMESSSEAGKVNISGTTYELVKDKFKCEHRGKIEAKNKGVTDMYFVEGVL